MHSVESARDDAQDFSGFVFRLSNAAVLDFEGQDIIENNVSEAIDSERATNS